MRLARKILENERKGVIALRDNSYKMEYRYVHRWWTGRTCGFNSNCDSSDANSIR